MRKKDGKTNYKTSSNKKDWTGFTHEEMRRAYFSMEKVVLQSEFEMGGKVTRRASPCNDMIS